MSMSFLPSRDTMVKEVDQWILLNKLDMLVGLCNCCLYKVLGATQECRECRVQSGILSIAGTHKQKSRDPDEELLGLC